MHACKDVEIHGGTKTVDLPFATDLEVKSSSVTKFYYHAPHSGCHAMNAQLMRPGAAGGPALAASPRWLEPLL
jgi:hypothetical protein